jgi:DnaK suppressor protein
MTASRESTALERIAARRSLIEQRLAAVEGRLADVRDARKDWTDEEHDPEGFALTFEWQQAQGASTEHRAELDELDAAEARVHAGTYGTCAVCHLEIPDAQLELRPARMTCVACVDRRGAQPRR